jgi:hypothetical protein
LKPNPRALANVEAYFRRFQLDEMEQMRRAIMH